MADTAINQAEATAEAPVPATEVAMPLHLTVAVDTVVPLTRHRRQKEVTLRTGRKFPVNIR